MRTSFFGFLGISFLALLVPLCVGAYSFSRNLTVGDVGSDVLELQKALNANESTQIAQTGPGSPGNETTYFGTLTADAVRRYQELYVSEILTPLGLFAGTGFFGLSTRQHLGSSVSGVSGTGSGKPTQKPSATPKQEVPHIDRIVPNHGGVGTKVVLHGTGFSLENNHVGSVFEEWRDVDSPDGTTMTITIKGPFPEDFMKEAGEFFADADGTMEYQIGTINAGGYKSNFIPFTFEF